MREPFDLDVVDDVLKNAIAKSMNSFATENALFTLGDALTFEAFKKVKEINGGDALDPSYYFDAGFHLANELLCELMPDPLHLNQKRVRAILTKRMEYLFEVARDSRAESAA